MRGSMTCLRRDERGLAMGMVLGLTLVLGVVVAGTLAYATTLRPQVTRNADWNAALAAAQAGVDDYIAQLNKKDNYWITVDCANVALKGPKAETNTCGWNSSTAPGWVNVQTGVPASGQFHYDVNASSFWKDGSVWIESTGRVDDVTRTIQVRLSRGGSTDFLYYTDFEDSDPANFVAYPPGGEKSLSTGGSKRDECGKSGTTLAKYWWSDNENNNRSDNGYCQEIQFAKSDVLDGAVHFNDTPLMGNTGSGSGTRPRFLQGYQTADPRCTHEAGKAGSNGVGTSAGQGKCWRNGSGAYPYVGNNGAVPASALYLPDNSDKFATFPGCHYYGDTRIRFNNNGTMDVWNTTSSGKSLLNPGTPAGINCGNAAGFVAASGQKYPAAKQTVPVPDDMVIYVTAATTGSATCTPGQIVNGPTSGSTTDDVIPRGAGTIPAGVTDVSYFNPNSVTTVSVQQWTKQAGSNTWKIDSKSGPTGTPTGDVHPTTFDCGLGNVYVEGTIAGQVTIAAQNNIVVTHNLNVASTTQGQAPVGPDMSGLVAANSVIVYHPVQRTSEAPDAVLTESPSASSSNGRCTAQTTPPTNDVAPTGGTTSSKRTKVCTWTQTRTYGSSYSNLSYPGATNSSGTRWIYSSIQTLAHSFWVANYNLGADTGNLSVRGSIAQKWRGAVGSTESNGTTHGFDKDYSYDTRLQFASPPYFPQWTNAVWGARTTGELKARY